MSLRISTNVPALAARQSMGVNQAEMAKSMKQLSTGSRITKAADDAAGLSISESMKSQIRSFKQAQRNANDGVSLLQVAEGGLGEVSNLVTRMRELAVQAASDTVGDTERGYINTELEQLSEEVQRISQGTNFNGTKLLDGSAGSFDFQVGIYGGDSGDVISFDASKSDATASNIGVDGLDFSDKESARDAIETLDEAQVKINGFRANIGAVQNRLTSTTSNISTQIENLSVANSRIRDTDVAESSSNFAKSQVMLNASTSVLAQANTVPAQALRLIG